MTFHSVIWLLVLVLTLPMLVIFFVLTEQRAWKQLSRFADSGILRQLTDSYSPVLRNTKALLVILVVSLCCFSLSRPQVGHAYQEEKRKGIDFIIALDVSRSMLAEDIKPNRLERAKLAILDLLERTEGDRVGLLAFSGSAFLQCPLTLDYHAFRQTLDSVNTQLLATQGTDIAGAILEAQASFANDDNQKILVLITDGEDLEAEGILQARKAAESGITIYSVGVGSLEGELIPMVQPNGSKDWLRNPGGELVRSKLDESTLRSIAAATNGAYVPLGASGQGLNHVYEHGLALVPEEEREAHLRKVPVERYQWPLAFAVGCLLVEILLGTRRLRRKSFPAMLGATRVVPGMLLLVVLMTGSGEALGAGKGKALYRKGKFQEAREHFRKSAEKTPEAAVLHYNLAAAQFKTGQFEESAGSLDRALELEKDNPAFQRDVYETRGYIRFQQGDSLKAEDPERAVELWTQGLLDYESALSLHDKEDRRREELQDSHDILERRLQDFTYQHGVNLYRDGEFEPAAKAFDDALKISGSERQDEILYNSGNAHYKLGEEQLGTPQETVKSWERALKEYDQAIESRAGEKFPLAEKNREIVRKRLEELKKQMPQSQDSDQKDDPDKKEDEQQNQDSQQEQNPDKKDQSEPKDQKEKGDQSEEQKGEEKEQKGEESEPGEAKEPNPSKPGEKKEGEEDENAQVMPGRMTPEQARQLLEQLRAYERKLPLGNLENIRRKDLDDGRKGRSW